MDRVASPLTISGDVASPQVLVAYALTATGLYFLSGFGVFIAM